MNYVDQVREHCRVHIIDPARAKGETVVEIRSGDIHSDLNFRNRYPLVCSAIHCHKCSKLCYNGES